MNGQGNSGTNSDSSLFDLINRNASECSYTNLAEADLMKPNQRVNVAGIVYWFKELCPPVRGRDYFLSFSIIDSSCSETPVQVIMFRRDKTGIPPINRIGSIVLLKNIQISRFDDKLQLKCPFFSSCTVFQLNPLSLWHPALPVGVTPPRFLSSAEVSLIEQLRTWINRNPSPLSKVSYPIKKLSEVHPGDMFDLVCKLCHVQVIDYHDVTIVTVADGTVPRFVTASATNAHDNEACKQYSHISVSIFVYDPYISKSIQGVSSGQFIYLNKVEASPAKLCAGTSSDSVGDHVLLRINLDRNVAFSVLPQFDPDVAIVAEAFAKSVGVASGSSFSRPPSQIASIGSSTVSLETNRRFATVRNVLECTGFPARFRLKVQPIKISEERIEDISYLYCSSCTKSYPLPTTPTQQEDPRYKKPGDSCDDCFRSSFFNPFPYPLSYIIYFTITVKDSTGEIDLAVIVAFDPSSFLPGVKPGNLYLDCETRETALCHLKKVFGYDPFDSTHLTETRPSPPMMDCIVESSLQKNKELFTPLHVISDTFLLHDPTTT